MRILQLLINLLLISTSFGQSKNDTVFIKREKTEDSYNIVYIDTNRSLVQYDYIIPNISDSNDLSYYNESYQKIVKDTNIIASRLNFKNFPACWSELHFYKGEYYVYSPSDWYYNFGFILTDSTLIICNGEGAYPEVIVETKEISNSVYYLKVLPYDKKLKEYKIYIIDKKNEIAIWKSTSNNYTEYYLMVCSKEVKRFPMIINNCSSGKCWYEFNFDEVNYEKLINNVQ